jgi:hypothetical protein
MWRRFHVREGRGLSWRQVVVALAIVALTVSVATRTFGDSYSGHPVVQTSSSQAARQHLAVDAIGPTHPVWQSAFLLVPVVSPHAPLAEPGVHSIEFSESLYNRPPPSSPS